MRLISAVSSGLDIGLPKTRRRNAGLLSEVPSELGVMGVEQCSPTAVRRGLSLKPQRTTTLLLRNPTAED